MKYKLDDIVTINNDSIKRDYFNAIDYLDTSSVFENRFEQPVHFKTSKEAPSRAKRLTRAGDTVISTVRPNMHHLGFIDGKLTNNVFSTGFAVVQPNIDLIDPYYLFLFLSSDVVTKKLQSIGENSTSTYPSIKPSDIKKLIIDLPELKKQRSIAKRMKVLEDKVKLNTQINDNLSTLIDEIYRNMIKISELKETNIDKIGSVVGGGTPSTKKQTYWGGKIPWLTPKDLSQNPTLFTSYGNKFITRSGLDNSSAKILPPKTILFSSRAPIGYISISKNKLATNQGFKSIIPNKGYPYSFIYELIKNETNKLINESNGSTFKEISSKQLKQHVISIPCKEEINLFDNQVNKLFETIQVLESETTTLNNLKKQLLSQFLN